MREDEGDPQLERLLEALDAPSNAEVRDLRRLSGGASMQTWSFDLVAADHCRPLILRRRPRAHLSLDTKTDTLMQTPDLETEGDLIQLAKRMGVPVPSVVARSASDAPLGEALIMTRLGGESLPRRILRDDQFERARERLAFQCGEALGNLHRLPLETCPTGLRDLSWQRDLDRLQHLCDHFGNVSPAHQLAVNWLRAQPMPESPRVLCHGDFRLGNLLVGTEGLVAVLDWELAHIGFAGEDLGYLCANVWRFGGEQPVGGFGAYRQLLDGYRSVCDTAPSMDELKLWELYAALGWGLVCLTMLEMVRTGADASLERAAVGRRLSESEIDILLLLEDLGG